MWKKEHGPFHYDLGPYNTDIVNAKDSAERVNDAIYNAHKDGLTDEQAEKIITGADLIVNTLNDGYSFKAFFANSDNQIVEVLNEKGTGTRYAINNKRRSIFRAEIVEKAVREEAAPIATIIVFVDEKCRDNDENYAIIDTNADGEWDKVVVSNDNCFEFYDEAMASSAVVQIGENAFFGQFVAGDAEIIDVAPKATMNEIVHPGHDFSKK